MLRGRARKCNLYSTLWWGSGKGKIGKSSTTGSETERDPSLDGGGGKKHMITRWRLWKKLVAGRTRLLCLVGERNQRPSTDGESRS